MSSSSPGRLVHDDTPELDQQLAECRVRPVQGGLALATLARSDLVRARGVGGACGGGAAAAAGDPLTPASRIVSDVTG